MSANKQPKTSDVNDNATQKAGQISDSPTEAPESGDPLVEGRSRGRIVDRPTGKAGKPANTTVKGGKASHNDNTSGGSGHVSQATESGRQRALPDQ
jgi:hypothetical protein